MIHMPQQNFVITLIMAMMLSMISSNAEIHIDAPPSFDDNYDCSLIKCLPQLACPPDSRAVASSFGDHDDSLGLDDDDESAEDDYDETLSNRYHEVPVESLGPLSYNHQQPPHQASLLSQHNETNNNATETVAKLTQRKRRDLMFTTDLEALSKHCCLEQKCICKRCGPVTKCLDHEVAIEMTRGLNVAGRCCSEYRCVPEWKCDADTDTMGVGFVYAKFYWRNGCKNCSCFGSEELCHSHCDNEHSKTEIVAPSKCYSIYLGTPMAEGATWTEGHDCVECQCVDGEERCVAPMCTAIQCEQGTVRIKGKCCPICKEHLQYTDEVWEEEPNTEDMIYNNSSNTSTSTLASRTTKINESDLSRSSASIPSTTTSRSDLLITVNITNLSESTISMPLEHSNSSTSIRSSLDLSSSASTTTKSHIVAEEEFTALPDTTVTSETTTYHAKSQQTDDNIEHTIFTTPLIVSTTEEEEEKTTVTSDTPETEQYTNYSTTITLHEDSSTQSTTTDEPSDGSPTATSTNNLDGSSTNDNLILSSSIETILANNNPTEPTTTTSSFYDNNSSYSPSSSSVGTTESTSSTESPNTSTVSTPASTTTATNNNSEPTTTIPSKTTTSTTTTTTTSYSCTPTLTTTSTTFPTPPSSPAPSPPQPTSYRQIPNPDTDMLTNDTPPNEYVTNSYVIPIAAACIAVGVVIALVYSFTCHKRRRSERSFAKKRPSYTTVPCSETTSISQNSTDTMFTA